MLQAMVAFLPTGPKSSSSAGRAAVLAGLLVLVFGTVAGVGESPSQTEPATSQGLAPIQRIGPDLLRIGNVSVNMARKEVSVPGTVTHAEVLEFIAVAKGGFKAYESALELDTNAVGFNLALILIGLDSARGVVPEFHFDPTLPQGDPVEISVEWAVNGRRRNVPAEELVFNTSTKATLSKGPWVYTGSTFVSERNAYLAEIEGTLIGFVHTPAPVIENPRPLGQGDYSANRLNPQLNLAPETAVTLTVRALPREKQATRGAGR